MEDKKDRLVFEAGGKLLALELDSVECLIEKKRVFLVPGRKPPMEGAIIHRGELVAVASLERIYESGGKGEKGESGDGRDDKGPYTIVIVREGTRVFGLHIDRERLSFLWKEGFENIKFRPEKGRYTKGRVEFGGNLAESIDCLSVYNEISNILSQYG